MIDYKNSIQEGVAQPAWLEALRQIWEAEGTAADVPLPAPDEQNPAAVFLPILQPFLREGHRHLLSGIDALGQQYSSLPFDAPSVAASLLAALSRQLLAHTSRVLALELKVAGALWRLEGATPEARFEHFVQRLSQPDGLLPLLEEYPVLARQLIPTIDQWVAVSLEFLDRLCADWDQIRATFAPEDDPGLLVEARSDVGDRHRGGRSVLLLTFRSGFRLVYKPKPLAIDQHFQELLHWLNGRGAEPPFQTLDVLDRGAYGWSAFVAEGECDSEAAVRRFYERQGAYLALLYALEATDLHFENLIAAGEHPMLVDLETLFHPRALMDGFLSAGEPAFEAWQQSVMRVGLLPDPILGNEEGAGVNISGLGGEDGQLTPRAIPRWERPGTDQMRLVRARREIPASRNRPRMRGQPVDALAYRARILVGFERMYRLLSDYRDALRSEALPRFAQDVIRFIARPTDLYARFLYDSFRPELLRDAPARERNVDRLWLGIQWQPALGRLIPAEQADLLKGDIPLFTTHPASRDLFTSQGEAIPAFFQESSLDLVRQRLCQLDEDDLTRQMGIINAAFDCLVKGTPSHARLAALSQGGANEVTCERLLDGACALGDELARTAIRGAGTAGWLGITRVREREWTLQPAGLDLYDGLPGITFFLAYLAALTGKQHYRSLAEAALHNIRALLKHPHKQEAIKSIGAFEGWGGLIYLFAHLGSLWKEPALFQEAAELAGLLPGLIEQDEYLDIIAGAAGCLSALLSLYAVAPAPTTLELATRCGDHLLACAHPIREGIGWKIPQQATPLTGFAHGNAGIALSLFRLAAASGADRFHQAALAALAYERSLFSPTRHNWPDLRTFEASDQNGQPREEEEQHFAVAWCHGATGIGLARLASLAYEEDASLRQEIEAALQTTLAHKVEAEYSLCHGEAGNLETLLEASQMLGPAPYQEALEQRTKILLHVAYALTAPTPGILRTTLPGLMLGLAGIGYTLLRVAAPERVPSILVLAPPVP
jgi:type 2 lantibiotic biosynthesis protein LanM